mgnify:CR=1 FL=1
MIIARGKNPVARLTAVSNHKRKLGFGMLKGKMPDLPDEFFFDPLPKEELRVWDGDVENPLR